MNYVQGQSISEISGTVRCGNPSGCGPISYSGPIASPGVFWAHETLKLGEGIFPLDAYTDVNPATGQYDLTMTCPACTGIFDLYVSAVGYQGDTLCSSGVTVLSGQSLHFDCFLQTCPSCLVPTVTSIACLSSTLDVEASTTCTATVSAAYDGISSETVSWSDAGSVSFSSNTCTISGTSCSVMVTGTGAGAASVKASYAGDSDNDPSSGTFSLTINAVPPIPEYPLGLPLLATLTAIGYHLIRRRTSTKN